MNCRRVGDVSPFQATSDPRQEFLSNFFRGYVRMPAWHADVFVEMQGQRVVAPS